MGLRRERSVERECRIGVSAKGKQSQTETVMKFRIAGTDAYCVTQNGRGLTNFTRFHQRNTKLLEKTRILWRSGERFLKRVNRRMRF